MLPPNTPFKLKFAHSGQVLNVPNASKAKACRSCSTSTSPASRTTTSSSSRSTATLPGFGPNTYVIEAGKNVFGQPLYVIPQQGEMGAPVPGPTITPFSVWELKQGRRSRTT